MQFALNARPTQIPMRRHEQQLQIAILKWWSMAHRGLGVADERVLFHVPNGGKRSRVEGAIFKAMGVRAGIPDLLLLVPLRSTESQSNYAACGLAIELKAPGRKSATTDSQDEMHQLFCAAGWYVCVCDSFDSAITNITNYLLLCKQ